MNRAKGYKWILSLTMALMTLAITFASSRFSLASIVTAEGLRRGTRAHCTRYESVCAGRPFHLNSSRGHTEAALGFAFDPIIWGPTSELSGRHTPPRVGIFGMSCFQGWGCRCTKPLYDNDMPFPRRSLRMFASCCRFRSSRGFLEPCPFLLYHLWHLLRRRQHLMAV